MTEKILKVGETDFDGIPIPIYQPLTPSYRESDNTLSLLTRMVNELREDNRMLREELMKKMVRGTS